MAEVVQPAVSDTPDSPKARVRQLIQKGHLDEALRICQTLIEQRSNDAEVWFVCGGLYAQLGRYPEAEQCFRTVIESSPNSVNAHVNLGRIYEKQGKLKPAIACYENVLQLDRSNYQHYLTLGNLYKDTCQYSAAIAICDRAIKLQPEYSECYAIKGNVFKLLGRYEDALDALQMAQKLDPSRLDYVAVYALVLNAKREYKTSFELLQPYISSSAQSHCLIAIAYAELADIFGCEKQAIAQLERILGEHRKPLPPQSLRKIYFELGRLYDRIGSYDKAFRRYKAAHEVYRRPIFDSAGFENLVSRIISIFNADFVKTVLCNRTAGQDLIFIVAMPRSGTTLIEQMLSCHPAIYGGGELDNMSKLVGHLSEMDVDHKPYPGCVRLLTEESCRKLADSYYDMLNHDYRSYRYSTDKMPHNFLCLGLIALLFPQAKILHCNRNPVDTCLSCYFQDFSGERHRYAGDLVCLGRYYNQYLRLMGHWRALFPQLIKEVRYEELISRPRTVLGDILSYCDLPWHEQCLEYFNSRRHVATASRDQVHQPIYASSIGRWKHYERHIGSLITALSPDPPT